MPADKYKYGGVPKRGVPPAEEGHFWQPTDQNGQYT